MKLVRFMILLPVFSLVTLLSAETPVRLPFNGDFEVGTAGYETVRVVRPDSNPKQEYLPLQSDSTVKYTGNASLRLENPYAEQTELHSSEFILKANRIYTVSGYIKSDRTDALPLTAGLEHYSFKHQNINVRKELSVSSDWQPFSFELKTKDFDAFFHLIFTIKSGNAGTVWLDDLKVAEKQTDPKSQVELGIYVDRKLYIGSERNAAITLKLHNPSGETIKRNLNLLAVDDYFNKSYPVSSFSASLEPGESKEFPLSWTIPRFGAYRLELDNKTDVRFFPAYLLCMDKTEQLKYRNDAFMPGINSGLSMVGPNRVQHGGWELSGQSPDEFIRALSLAGVRMIRGHDDGSFYWGDLEPEPGKFEASRLEQSLAVYDKYHLAYIPVLVAVCSERLGGWERRAMLDWQKQLCSTAKDWMNRGKYFHPPQQNWRNYVEFLATRLKDRVPAWEIINEPQFIMSAAEYMNYLASASEILRKVKADTYIVGICSTSDFGADIGKFANEVMEKGGLKYLDAVSFHPYASRELTSANPADLQISSFRKNVNNFDKKPIWEGELYYLFDGPTMQEWYRSGIFEPHHLARRYIIDCGEGCAQSHPVASGQLWKRMLVPNYEGGKCNEANPSSSLAAFSTMSDFLSSAVPVYKKKSNGIIIYGFRHRNGKLFAALWKYASTGGMKIDLTDFDGKDIFGNPLPKQIEVLNEAPLYFLQGRYSENEFMERLKHLEIIYENPLEMIPVIRLSEENHQLKALITLINNGNQDVEAFIGLKGACRNQKPFNCRIGAQKTETFLLDVSRGEGTDSSVSLYVNGKMKTLTATTVEMKIAAAGETFSLSTADKHIAGSGRFSVEDKKLNLELDIDDQTSSAPRADLEAWQQDGIEFFIDPEAYNLNNGNSGSYSPEIFRFFVLPRLPEGQQFKIWKNTFDMTPEDFTCKVTSNEKGYKVILSMDLKKLKLKKNAIGIEIKISDAEGTQAPKTTLFFSGGNLEPYKNRNGFGIFKF